MRLAYVNSICQKYDAISDAILNEVKWLGEAGHNVRLFTYRCDHEEISHRIVSDAAELVCDSFFKTADVVLFHYGVYYPLFDAIFAVSLTAKKLVVFHNITPAEFLPSKSRPLIEKSFEQLQNARYASKVICDSQVNLSILRDHGISCAAEVVPLAAWRGTYPPVAKPSFMDGTIRLAFVGRLVQSKGPTDLLALVRHVMRETAYILRVDILFNPEMSDPATVNSVVSECRAIETSFPGRAVMALHPNGDNEFKNQLLADADLFCLPTRHEGFCVPIIEAMAAGCKVLSYANSNVVSVCAGLAALATDQDLNSFIEAGVDSLAELTSAVWKNGQYKKYSEKALAHAQSFSEERVKVRFLNAAGALSLV